MTTYFSRFPTITHNSLTIQDITVRLDFLKKIKENVTTYDYKILSDNERPEDVAQYYYNDPNLYWIVLYMNDVTDPYYGWILSDDRLYDYIVAKYGAESVYDTHHYETTSSHELGEGIWVNSTEPFSSEITNFDYEKQLNEEKRKIKILKDKYISQVLVEYNNALKES